jgi:hypothetical protein
VVAIVLGLALIVTPIALSLFSRAHSADRLAAGVRPAMTKTALSSYRADLDLVRAAVTEFNGPTQVHLAAALNITPQRFSSLLRTRYPEVASGARALPSGLAQANAILTALERNRARFESADSFPLSGVSVRIAPWIFVATGAVLTCFGLLAVRGQGRAPLAVLLGIGLLVLAFSLAASLPQKASDTNQLVVALEPAFSRQSTDAVPGQVASAKKFASQLESQLLPAFARQLKLSRAQFDALLKRDSPAISRVLPQLNTILTTFGTLGAALVADRHLYVETKKIPFRTLVWLIIGASALAAASAALACALESRRRNAEPPPQAQVTA